MDTIHDLGGMQGFGPIDTASGPFDEDWERRMFALARLTYGPDWTIDWWRHIIERIPPAAYLSMSYFEKWCLTYLTGFVSSGVFTAEEVIAGHTETRQPAPEPGGLDGARARLRRAARRFDRALNEAPRFAPGDTVRTATHIAANHTRLPRYARGRLGTVIAHRGAHVLPDASAEGREMAQHLYTVAFAAPELWGAGADSRDSVTLDLWESYLGPA